MINYSSYWHFIHNMSQDAEHTVVTDTDENRLLLTQVAGRRSTGLTETT